MVEIVPVPLWLAVFFLGMLVLMIAFAIVNALGRDKLLRRCRDYRQFVDEQHDINSSLHRTIASQKQSIEALKAELGTRTPYEDALAAQEAYEKAAS